MTVTYQNIRHQGAFIPYINYFKVTSRLHFHEDYLTFKIEHNRKTFSGEIISLILEKQFQGTQAHLMDNLKIYQTFQGDVVFTELHLNTKDVLLELFSSKKRSFQLFVSYVQDNKYYSTSFTATVSIIV